MAGPPSWIKIQERFFIEIWSWLAIKDENTLFIDGAKRLLLLPAIALIKVILEHLIKQEFIRRLHERYAGEGVAIPCPVRAINYEQEKGT